MTTILNPQPQPTDGNLEAPEGTAIPTGRQAGGGDVATSPVVAGEPPGSVQVRREVKIHLTPSHVVLLDRGELFVKENP
jgi:hypothetical protein